MDRMIGKDKTLGRPNYHRWYELMKDSDIDGESVVVL